MTTSIKTNRKRTDLTGPWQVAWATSPKDTAELEFKPCTVPGCFETDLHALGVVPDPFFGMNPAEVNDFAQRQHIYYVKTFQARVPDGTEPYLIFEGVDCFADVYINKARAASFGNMLIEHEINVSPYLVDGENELMLHIRPARVEALKYEYPQSVFAQELGAESLYVRKAPHMFGWDIMPRFISAGIYRPVTLEYRPAQHFEEVFLSTPEIAPDGSFANMYLHYKILGDLYTPRTIKVEMACEDSAVTHEFTPLFIAGRHKFTIENPKLWHPKGRGPANLYDVTITLYAGGQAIDQARFRHGVRTVALQRTSTIDHAGTGEFVFIINGEKVFAKGTNWVPADAFHHRDVERIPAMIDMANDLNCNMIRCWGGNVYENELFYDLCDESGIMVWQDFSMACAIYPQDEGFQKVIADEAKAVIKRLRGHACVVLWSGDNECDSSHSWRGSGTNPNDNVLTRKILPEAVRIYDGTRPYIASSPFIDDEAFKVDKGERFIPEVHLWGPRDYFKGEFYSGSKASFVSEIGYHGCPWPESIARFISPDKLWPWQDNEEWLLHASSPMGVFDYRIPLMARQIEELFTHTPDDLDSFAFASQAVQAEAKKFFVEMFRMDKWKRTGILWWNLIDGWPQFSDAIVDYYFNKKLAYTFIKNVQQDVCIMMAEPEAWHQEIVLVNDLPRDKIVTCEIRDVAAGEVVFDGTFTARADASVVIGKIPFKRNRQRLFVIKWTGDVSGVNHYLAGQPPFDLHEYKRLLAFSEIFKT